MVGARGETLTGAEERGDGASILGNAFAAGLDDQSCEARMKRVARHLADEMVVRRELAQEQFRMLEGV